LFANIKFDTCTGNNSHTDYARYISLPASITLTT